MDQPDVYLRALRPADLIHLDAASEGTDYPFISGLPGEELSLPPGSPLDQTAGGHGLIGFAIIAGGVLAGQITLTGIDHQKSHCTVTMGIARRIHRSQGIGTRALIMALRYAFHSLGLASVSTDTLSSNAAAIRCLEKTGFLPTGVQKRILPDANGFVDRLHYAITRERFDRDPGN